MDSSTIITPATSTSPAVYGYVDKYPSPLIWRLKADSTWMNNAQMNWVFIYTILKSCWLHWLYFLCNKLKCKLIRGESCFYKN